MSPSRTRQPQGQTRNRKSAASSSNRSRSNGRGGRSRGGEPTLTREDWLAAALAALEEGGIEGVHVLALSHQLGVSRGSFYWHFQDRRDLLRSILQWWEAETTDGLAAAIEAESSSPRERLFALIRRAGALGVRAHDPAIRAWAHYDREAARFVARVDRKRVRWLEGLFRAFGFPGEQARVRAQLLGGYLVGRAMEFGRQPRAQAEREARAQLRLLTAR